MTRIPRAIAPEVTMATFSPPRFRSATCPHTLSSTAARSSPSSSATIAEPSFATTVTSRECRNRSARERAGVRAVEVAVRIADAAGPDHGSLAGPQPALRHPALAPLVRRDGLGRAARRVDDRHVDPLGVPGVDPGPEAAREAEPLQPRGIARHGGVAAAPSRRIPSITNRYLLAGVARWRRPVERRHEGLEVRRPLPLLVRRQVSRGLSECRELERHLN